MTDEGIRLHVTDRRFPPAGGRCGLSDRVACSDANVRYHGERADFGVTNSSKAKFTLQVIRPALAAVGAFLILHTYCAPAGGAMLDLT